MPEEDERNVVNLMIDQIEFADVILLNKTDLVSAEEAARIEAIIRTLNTSARIVRTVQSSAPLKEILNTGLFTMEKAAQSPGWLKVMRGEEKPESEEFNIRWKIYRAHRPFHPRRLETLLMKYFLIQTTEMEEVPEEEQSEAQVEPTAANGGAEKGDAEKLAEAVAGVSIADRRRETMDNVRRDWGQVLRSKGVLWLAGRDKSFGYWGQVRRYLVT